MSVEQPLLPPLIIKKSSSGYYVYTYKNEWDAEKRRSYRAKSTKVGTIVGGGKEGQIRWNEEFLQEHEELREFSCERKDGEYVFAPLHKSGSLMLEQALAVKTRRAGATWALDNIVAASPIGAALKETFTKADDYRKILSIAYFIILSGARNIRWYEDFAENTRLPWDSPLSEESVSDLFSRITSAQVESFLQKLTVVQTADNGENSEKKVVLVLDSTSISDYASRQSGFDQNSYTPDEDLSQINVLLSVDMQTGIPIYYSSYDGNVPAISTINKELAEVVGSNASRAVLVSEKAYDNLESIDECLRNKAGFIFNMKCDVKDSLVQQLIDSARDELNDLNNRDWFTRVIQVTKELNWSYKSTSSKDTKARLYCHIYFDRTIAQAQRENLLQRIDRVREKFELVKPLTDNEQTLLQSVFVKDGTGYFVSNESVMRLLADKGCRVLLSNTVKDARSAWIAYEERCILQDAFKTVKLLLARTGLRTADNQFLAGKVFVRFIAAAIAMMVRCRLRRYTESKTDKDKLPVVYESDAKVLSMLNRIPQVLHNGQYCFGNFADQEVRCFEALDVEAPSSVCEAVSNSVCPTFCPTLDI